MTFKLTNENFTPHIDEGLIPHPHFDSSLIVTPPHRLESYFHTPTSMRVSSPQHRIDKILIVTPHTEQSLIFAFVCVAEID